MKIIRWKGLIAFAVVSIALVGSILIFSEGIVKSFIETSLTNINKAQVDVGSVEIEYSPLSVAINDIQVTDNENPDNNALQISQAIFSLMLSDLLLEKVNIDEMILKRVRTDTERKTPGYIPISRETEVATANKSEGSLFEMPPMSMPDVDKILKDEKLDTIKNIKTLSDDLVKTETEWNVLSQEINNKERWDSYEEKSLSIKRFYRGSFSKKLKALKEAKKLSNEYKQELVRIRTAKDKINTDIKRLDSGYKAVRSAPKADMSRIAKKYKVSELSEGNISQLLFGKKVAEYIEVAKSWRKRLKPYFPDGTENIPVVERQRLEGEDILFKEYNPRPTFYVRRASMDIETAAGIYSGVVNNVSSDQVVSNKPIRFEFNKQKTSQGESEVIAGVVDFTKKDQGYVKAKYTMKSKIVKDVAISSNQSLSLSLDKAVMDLVLSVKLQNDILTGDSKANYTKVGFNASSISSGSLSNAVASSFSKVERFSVDTRVSGALNRLKIKIKSDLDDQIGRKIKEHAKASKKKFNRQLKAGISAKINAPMEKLESRREAINKIKQEVENKEKSIKKKISEINNKFKK